MLRFTTHNSTYEVDQDAQYLRRLEGANDPTPNTGEDGVWQPFDDLALLPDWCVCIVWSRDDGRVTITSPVIDYVIDDIAP